MRQLLLATHNQGKLHELTQLLAGVPLQVVSLRSLGIARDVAETGSTFAANATLKAVEYSRLTDALTLADSNEEGANLLALQTRQQLSTTALSLASQASQAVLRLFG